MQQKVTVDLDAKTVTVPHLGLTLRSIFGAAVTALYGRGEVIEKRPKFRMLYKGIVVGEIRLAPIGEAIDSKIVRA